VLYCTRVQQERFEDQALYEEVKDAFIVDGKTLKEAKQNMIVMHPLPRNAELSKEVDDDPRAAYFRQVSFENPLFPDTESYADGYFTDALRHVRPHGSPRPRYGTLDGSSRGAKGGRMRRRRKEMTRGKETQKRDRKVVLQEYTHAQNASPKRHLICFIVRNYYTVISCLFISFVRIHCCHVRHETLLECM
jgi:hypothetical protein